MEELNNVDPRKCQGCGEIKKKIFSRFSDCSLCGKAYSAKPFCSNCCCAVRYKLSDYLLFKKYCFVCYFTIESSKQSSEAVEEEKTNIEDSEDTEESAKNSLMLPSQDEVSFI